MYNNLATTLLAIALWFQGDRIVRLDPALDQILPPDARLEELGDGFVFLEGPVWVRAGGYLLFSNMPRPVSCPLNVIVPAATKSDFDV